MKPLLKVEEHTSGSLPHEPVITIKTWQERFDEEFSYLGPVGEMDIIKQFISDLRKKDLETITDILMTNSNVLNSIDLIKEYYKE